MREHSSINAVLKTTEKYEVFLNGLTEEQFTHTPSPGVWSYSEVYSHIFQANIGSLIAMERCMHGNKPQTGWPTLAGKVILFFGFLPSLRFKAPAQIASLAAKTSVEEARNYIIKFKDRFAQIAPQARKAPKANRAKHPRLGMLNALQWLRFIEIHTDHHFRQLGRVQKMLAAFQKSIA